MILEVDCGNTLIKWRLLDGSDHRVRFEGAALDENQLLAQLQEAGLVTINKGRIVSVRAEAETASLIEVLSLKYSIPVILAESTKKLAGVTNGYLDYTMLGADRWLAIVAAFALKKTACLVLDIGSAVTADFVDSAGVHLGGFICPGIKMLRGQLGAGTARVTYLSVEGAAGNKPGQKTSEAVVRGTEMMLLGFVAMQVQKAHELWGSECSILLTGGDAGLVQPHFNEAITVPDLVFRGLALACPD